ncbi:MAG: cation transporter dimerization domain-containing protein, partial [Candidatus Bipolaricaulia bacterium]
GAAVLVRENAKMILGQSPDARFYEDVKGAVGEVAGVGGVHDMIAEYIGPGIVHLDLDLELAPETTVGEADRIVKEVSARLRDLGVAYCKIHPCAHSGAERRIHR